MTKLGFRNFWELSGFEATEVLEIFRFFILGAATIEKSI